MASPAPGMRQRAPQWNSKKSHPLRTVTTFVTRERYLAMLLSDAVRWMQRRVDREPIPGDAPADTYAGGLSRPEKNRRARGAIAVVTQRKYWSPPQLNSDHPGVSAYSVDYGSYDYEREM